MDYNFSDDDFEDSIEINPFADDDEFVNGPYEVWVYGYDLNGRETGYEQRFDTFKTETAALEFIDELIDSGLYTIREDYEIPEDVVEIEIRGEKYADDDDFLAESELFTVRPVDISNY